jgi:HalX domain-containing protein
MKRVLKWIKSLFAHCAPKDDLQRRIKRMAKKLSEIKADVAAAAARSTEAFAEIGKRIADLQKQIDDLISGVSDPEITDEAFLTNLQTLKGNVDSLADIVPNPTEPPAEPPTP